MAELMLLTLLNCPMAHITDDSGIGWNNHDHQIYINNKNSCERKFGEEFKCMKRFIKRDDMAYWITCTPPIKDLTKNKQVN